MGICLISNRVQRVAKSPRLSHAAKAAVAGLLTSLLLLTAALSASHALHRWLHGDGADNDHACLVCSFAKGQVSAADVAAFVAVLIFFTVCSLRSLSTTFLSNSDYRLSPSRAPPFLSTSPTVVG